jgi:hypothetical protein
MLKHLFFLLIPTLLYAQKSEEKITQAPIGNFSLPPAQQPGPLVSFGENIIDQGVVQAFLFADAFIGKNSYATDLVPGVLYGITDRFSFFFNVPFAPRDKDRRDHSSGIEDIFGQFEYGFYQRDDTDSATQATIVAGVAFPTGSSTKNPPTGFGSTSFFVGATFNRTLIDWFFFTSPGAVLTTEKHRTQFGNQLLYQFGTGRYIPSPTGWIFAWMVEFTGQYSWKDKIKGRTDPDSGGNVIYITPSIWISSKKIILQLGAGYPVVQNLFGHQSKKFLSLDFNFGYTF